MQFELLNVGEFLDELASNSPAPGGGSVAALGGALGAALVSMVSNLTIGKEKYRESWAEMEGVRAASDGLRREFVRLMNADTESFNSFMAAMKLPKGTDEEKSARTEAIQRASKIATETPLRTLERCAEMAELAARAAKLGNPNAASDVGSAALFAMSAGRAAAYNVRINLPDINDREFASEVCGRMKSALESLSQFNIETERTIDERLGE
jgi:glutamate formiminotransferase/formiminotetrahydrofolate cyclodeaminase